MAVYNEIGIGRWNRFIQKLTDMKGGPPARQLASEIVFSHSIFHGAENRYLEQWNTYAIAAGIPAIAANNSALRIRNPAGSNVIAVVEMLNFNQQQAATSDVRLEFGPIGTDLAVINTPVRMDARIGAVSQSNMIWSSQNNAVLGQLNLAFGFVFLQSNGQPFSYITTENQEFPILPGDAFQVRNNTVNNSINVAIQLRERFLEPAERF